MPTLFEINSDETFFYPFTFSVNKCDVTLLMTIAWVCVPNKIKIMNVKVFNSMWGVKLDF